MTLQKKVQKLTKRAWKYAFFKKLLWENEAEHPLNFFIWCWQEFALSNKVILDLIPLVSFLEYDIEVGRNCVFPHFWAFISLEFINSVGQHFIILLFWYRTNDLCNTKHLEEKLWSQKLIKYAVRFYEAKLWMKLKALNFKLLHGSQPLNFSNGESEYQIYHPENLKAIACAVICILLLENGFSECDVKIKAKNVKTMTHKTIFCEKSFGHTDLIFCIFPTKKYIFLSDFFQVNLRWSGGEFFWNLMNRAGMTRINVMAIYIKY